MRLTTRQRHQINGTETVILNAVDENGKNIQPIIEHRTLGINLKRDLTWGSNLKYGEKAVIPDLRKKLGILWLVSKYFDTQARLKLANGLIMSKIIYMIQLWGSIRPSWIMELQRLQNRAARFVLRKNRYEKVSTLLDGCKWLSVSQLITFHSVLLLWKCINKGKWNALKNGLILNRNYTVRKIKGRIQLTKDSWKCRTITIWNSLPIMMRRENEQVLFKGSLRTWVKQNTCLKY